MVNIQTLSKINSNYQAPVSKIATARPDFNNVINFKSSLNNASSDNFIANFVPFLGVSTKKEFPTINTSGPSFDNIGGFSYAKKEVEVLRDIILDPSSHFQYQMPNKAILLSGPVGNGKTMLVKALAKDLSEAGIPVIRASSSNFNVNETKDNIQNLDYLFDYAHQKAKSNDRKTAIIFIDNIETLCGREKNSANEEAIKANKLLAKFKENLEYQVLDKDSDINIILIAETNNESLIDPVVFSKFNVLRVQTPKNSDERFEILKTVSDNNSYLYGPWKEGNDALKEIGLRSLAEKTRGCSAQALEQILIRAYNNAQLANPSRNFIMPEDTLAAYLDYTFGKIEKNNSPTWFFKVSAAHEFGHSVVRHVMKTIAEEDGKDFAKPQEIDTISLNPRSNVSASVILKNINNPSKSFEHIFGELTSNYASIPAQYLICDSLIDAGPANDISVNTDMLKDAVKIFGMGNKTGAVQADKLNQKNDNSVNQSVKQDEQFISKKTLDASFKIIKFYKPFIEKMVEKYSAEFEGDITKLKPINISGDDFYQAADAWVNDYVDEFNTLKSVIKDIINQAKPDYIENQ